MLPLQASVHRNSNSVTSKGSPLGPAAISSSCNGRSETVVYPSSQKSAGVRCVAEPAARATHAATPQKAAAWGSSRRWLQWPPPQHSSEAGRRLSAGPPLPTCTMAPFCSGMAAASIVSTLPMSTSSAGIDERCAKHEGSAMR